MSPTEFSNYIKQRAMQQQLHHSHSHPNGHLGPIGTASPSRSLSPNPLAMNGVQDPYFFQNGGINLYPPYNNGPRNMFDSTTHYTHPTDAGGPMYTNGGGGGPGKFSPYFDQHNYYGMGGGSQQTNVGGPIGSISGSSITSSVIGQTNNGGSINGNGGGGGGGSVVVGGGAGISSMGGTSPQTPINSPGANQDNTKLLDGLNSFYTNPGPYQHLLVAN